ncbi:WD repeat-containing protein 46-like isoform X2 [Nilaparvata lugens]|uniref:WD repeat-containing protein 46-like isoform X1 n=1 Tax=Nilaparvata lugens TaxID=108931 RepID=UPI00193D65AB|nr:WD repeat-containing protein 46-like isoform X1 [Nilaparvata lugens]XP_039281121.1 WD repeat-containing protein 46-like isoform X2 [Nilaparvata lugens]
MGKRYFEQKPAGTEETTHDNDKGGGLKVFGGSLKKSKRPKHMLQRRKNVENVMKMAKLSKNTGSNKDVKKQKVAKTEIIERPKIAPEKLEVYSRGAGLSDVSGIKTKLNQQKVKNKENTVLWASELAARTEILLTEEFGCLEAEDGEVTRQYTQKSIVDSVDITSATKSFELDLRQYGPYRIDFTRNGRYLTLGGKKGHVAAFDWVTKKLMCEINVMEEVFDIQWLHNELMYAVAQKEWVYIYDRQGVELHCLKAMNKPLRLQFLPYHFLLSAVNEDGWLSWLDISIGKMVARTSSHCGRPISLVQNPYNAILCLGNAKGVVSMWSPTVQKPLAKMLCHKMIVQGLTIDNTGKYMATSAPDHSLKVWDIRNLDGPLQHYQLQANATHLSFSQKGLLAVAMGNVVEIFKDCCTTSADKAYMRHRMTQHVSDLEFCPYEDVLGIGSRGGYHSILVPGSGEANFDAYEANPFQTREQRREAEVKALLEKIQPEMITLDPTSIIQVNVPSLKQKIEAKKQLLLVKPPKIDFTPRMKKKRHGNTVRMARSRKIVQAEAKQQFVKAMSKAKASAHDEVNVDESTEKSVLDRFKKKKKTGKPAPVK